MANFFNNILETIGNTPIVRINKLAPPGVNLDGKDPCELLPYWLHER